MRKRKQKQIEDSRRISSSKTLRIRNFCVDNRLTFVFRSYLWGSQLCLHCLLNIHSACSILCCPPLVPSPPPPPAVVSRARSLPTGPQRVNCETALCLSVAPIYVSAPSKVACLLLQSAVLSRSVFCLPALPSALRLLSLPQEVINLSLVVILVRGLKSLYTLLLAPPLQRLLPCLESLSFTPSYFSPSLPVSCLAAMLQIVKYKLHA